jgi:hypothetical protein
MADFSSSLPVSDKADGSVTGGTAAASSILIGGQYNSTLPTLTTTQQAAVQLDSSGRLLVDVGLSVPPSNLLATGTLTGLSQTVTLNLQSTASVNVDISGSGFVGTIVVYESTPSSQRNLGLLLLNNSAIQSSITANGNYRVVGLPTSATISVAFSAYTSGSVTVNIYGSTAPYIVQPYSANAANVLTTAYLNDGSGNAVASYNSQLDTADVINTSISSGSITVGTTPVAARVGGANLANRKMLMISPLTSTLYLGSTSSVTTATGIPIQPGQVMSFAFSANVTPYLISATSGTVNIFEGA